MRLAVHIFRKDLRRLWPMLALLLAMHAVSIWLDGPEPGPEAEIFRLTLPLASALLIAIAIQGENLCDERAFWLARPYSRKALAGAKALFVLAALNLPFLAADIARLALHGIAIAPQFPHLLWRQIVITGWVALGAVALGSITATLIQFVFACLAVALGAAGGAHLASAHAAYWGPFDWIRGTFELAVFATVAGAVVLLQFARRRAPFARASFAAGLGASMLVYFALPFDIAFGLQSRLTGTVPAASNVQIAFDYRVWGDQGVFTGRSTQALIRLPLRVTGVPAGTEIQFDRAQVSLSGAGAEWRSERNVNIFEMNGVLYADILLDKRISDRFHGGTVDVRLAVVATLFKRETPVIATRPGRVPLPGRGSCLVDGWFPLNPSLSCVAEGGRQTTVKAEDPATGVATRPDRVIGPRSYGPDPADVEILPYTMTPPSQFLPWELRGRFGPGSRIVFTTSRPVAHIVREFPAKVRLANYLVKQV